LFGHKLQSRALARDRRVRLRL